MYTAPRLYDMDELKNSENENAEDVYVGGTCAIRNEVSLEDYIKGHEHDDYVAVFFVVNSTGCDKKKLAVIGNKTLNPVCSMPVKYYHCEGEPIVTTAILVNYLSNWNNKLQSIGQNIKFLMSLPEHVVKQLSFSNIQVINSSKLEAETSTTDKIIKCFKYHYRKLQIIKSIVNGNGPQEESIMDSINIISAAWHNVSSNYLHHIFYPDNEEMLEMDDDEERLSLSNWCEEYNVPINIKVDGKILDDFTSCDDQIQSIKLKEDTNGQNTDPVEFKVTASNSGIEAYQAMMRLVSYLQGEGATQATINTARSLEEHLEYGALTEIQEIIDRTRTFVKSDSSIE